MSESEREREIQRKGGTRVRTEGDSGNRGGFRGESE